MQLLCKETEEDNIRGLCVFSSVAKRFTHTNLNIPQMGWSEIVITRKSPLVSGLPRKMFAYFANSYYVQPRWDRTVSYGIYGNIFSSIEHRDNFYGVQFHPEKSFKSGIKILRNFCERC